MSPWFKRSKDKEADQAADSESLDQLEDGGEDPGQGPSTGPFDVSQVSGRGKRLDLGAIWLPARPGTTVRLDVDKTSRQAVAVAVSHDSSTLRLQAFAAPKTAGLWDQVRQELISQALESGGQAQEVDGPMGKEVTATMPVEGPSGKKSRQKLRFVGVDGPRWFLRGRFSGPAAREEDAAKLLREVLTQLVVVRGTEAHPPRDLLTLHPPGQGSASDEEADQAEPGKKVFRRGPEITEVR